MIQTYSSVSKAEFDRKIAEIFSRPEYIYLKNGVKDFIENLKEQISNWIQHILSNLFSNLPNIPSLSGGISTVFLIAGLLVIMAIIIFIVVKAVKPFEKSRRIREILGEKIDDKVTSASLMDKSADYARTGEYRMAIRYGYISLLLLMHQKDILYLEETKTNREILQTLKNSNFRLISAFEQLACTFNASWYGHKVYSREAYEKWNKNINLLWNRIAANEE